MLQQLNDLAFYCLFGSAALLIGAAFLYVEIVRPKINTGYYIGAVIACATYYMEKIFTYFKRFI